MIHQINLVRIFRVRNLSNDDEERQTHTKESRRDKYSRSERDNRFRRLLNVCSNRHNRRSN
jgi:hypothetical protein